jgi:PHP family Zn ribbon phosphoesterase
VSDDSRDLEFFGRLQVSSGGYYRIAKAYQDLESTVESHLQVTLLILGECPEQTLLEDGSHERIGDYHETVGSVCQRFHLEQTDLIETSSVDIDGVTVLRCSLGKTFVVLKSAYIQDVLRWHTLVARLKCLTLSRSIS